MARQGAHYYDFALTRNLILYTRISTVVLALFLIYLAIHSFFLTLTAMKKISKGFNNSVLLTLLFVACHVTGCKKIAVLPEITAGTQNAKSSVDTSNNKFFLLPSNTSPTIKTIARAIKKHDGEKKFLKNFIKRVGYPKWDQAKIINSNTVSFV